MGVYALYNVYDVSLRSSRNQWKKYLTSMQIIQFIIDIVIVYFGSKFINL
jgi:fatty acid elongase 3